MALKKYNEFPDTIDITGKILLLADPITGELFKIDQSLLGGGGGGTTPDLQAVTDVGFVATNSLLVVGDDKLIGVSKADSSSAIALQSSTANGINLQYHIAGSYAFLKADNITDTQTWQLPDANGTLAISVNGIAADSTGNIVLSAPKIFKAVISQSGTSTPTMTVLANTIGGTATATRQFAGQYRITFTGVTTITSSNSIILMQGNVSSSASIFAGVNASDSIYIGTKGTAGGSYADGFLSGAPISFELYV